MLLALSFSFIAAPTWAQITWEVSPAVIPVYSRPDKASRVLFNLSRKERFALRGQDGKFRRIQARRRGKWRTGFVFGADLDIPEPEVPRHLGLGINGLSSRLAHEGKTFQTEDQVKYTTDAYASQAMSFALTLQFGDRDFWRLHLGQRQTRFTSKAITDVSAIERALELQHTFIMVAFDHAWNPFQWRPFYVGGGIEMDRAMEVKLSLAGAQVPTSDQQRPFYFGVYAMAGFQLRLPLSLSVFGEVRPIFFVNQEPMIQGLETAAGVFYWF